jgi:riboflavin kinase
MNLVPEIGKHLPYFTEGLIVKGFGRGSKQLGFPTANFSEEVIAKLPSELVGGIY